MKPCAWRHCLYLTSLPNVIPIERQERALLEAYLTREPADHSSSGCEYALGPALVQTFLLNRSCGLPVVFGI